MGVNQLIRLDIVIFVAKLKMSHYRHWIF